MPQITGDGIALPKLPENEGLYIENMKEKLK